MDSSLIDFIEYGTVYGFVLIIGTILAAEIAYGVYQRLFRRKQVKR